MAPIEQSFRIRRIRPGDGPLLRELRLRSLSESPDAFGQRAEDAALQSDQEWSAAASVAADGERRAWFIAERDAEADGHRSAVGIVLGWRRVPDTLLIFSMWVDPTARRSGLGGRLIEAAEAWALTWGATTTLLWVFAGNEQAVRFYHRLGFVAQAEGEDAVRGAQHGAVAMVRPVSALSER